MDHRRLVGIDLGITSAHTVRVLDEAGTTIAKRKCWPTTESLSEIEAVALAGCPEGTTLEVVMEPTGPAWLPIAVFFSARGHRVFRVSSQKAADLRRFLSRHTKTNGIDAETLAKLPIFDPAGSASARAARGATAPPSTAGCGPPTASPRTGAAAQAAHQGPGAPADADEPAQRGPRRGRPGRARALCRPERPGQGGREAPRRADRQGVARPAGTSARPPVDRGRPGGARALRGPPGGRLRRSGRRGGDRGAPVARGAERARLCTARRAKTRIAGSTPAPWRARCPAWPRWAGPPSSPPWETRRGSAGARRSAPTPVSSPRPPRPGETDRKGQAMSKAGSSLLRTTLVRAADTARKLDPQLARLYYVQMTERGKDHLGALCVVAANLAERAVGGHGAGHALRDLRHRRPVRSPPRRPRRSSPSASRSRPRYGPGGAPGRVGGRPPKTSSRDNRRHALEAAAHGATFPPTHLPRWRAEPSRGCTRVWRKSPLTTRPP